MKLIEKFKAMLRDTSSATPSRESEYLDTEIEAFHRLWSLTQREPNSARVDMKNRWDYQATRNFEEFFGDKTEERINVAMMLIDSGVIPLGGDYKTMLKFLKRYFSFTEESKTEYSKISSKTRAVIIEKFSRNSNYEIESLLLAMAMCEDKVVENDLVNELSDSDELSDFDELSDLIADCNEINYERMFHLPDDDPTDCQEYRLYEIAFLYLWKYYNPTVVEEFLNKMIQEQIPIPCFKALDIIFDWDRFKDFPLQWASEIAEPPHRKIFTHH